MKNSKRDYEKPKRRFSEATDGPIIMQYYATMRTTDLAEKLGLTVKQIMDFVYRHNTEPWAKKEKSVRSRVNSENVQKRWAKRKKAEL